uniref:Putative protease Do-like 14 n=1 Tax=Anthurium amnicola TaxID=1678845 RepID=A0A1D1ZEB5_9ARAE
MLFQVPPKKRARADPWERDAKEESYSPDVINYIRNYSRRHPKFYSFPENLYLDIYTKRAALKASPAVVSLVSYSDEEEIFHSSGTVIEGDDTSGIVLTSASLIRCPTNKNAVVDNVKVVAFLSDGKSYEGQILAYDLYYNIAALRIQSNAPLPIASLTHLDDSITVDPNELCSREEKAFQLRPHSSSFNLIPGDKVIAIGRYFIKPFELMAAPGEFRLGKKSFTFMSPFNHILHLCTRSNAGKSYYHILNLYTW